MQKQIQLFAEYNRMMNGKVYATAAQHSPVELAKNKGAFFSSILGTLNHILVGDLIWLNRFSKHPSDNKSLQVLVDKVLPTSLDILLHDSLDTLRIERVEIDELIMAWVSDIQATDLAVPLSYKNMKGEQQKKEFGSLLFHFFNHQTHHRGQVTTMLSQSGLDVGVTDFLAVIPNLEF